MGNHLCGCFGEGDMRRPRRAAHTVAKSKGNEAVPRKKGRGMSEQDKQILSWLISTASEPSASEHCCSQSITTLDESSQYDEEATKEAFHDCKEEFQDCKSRISSRNSKSRISPHSDVDSDFKTATEGGSDLEIDDMVEINGMHESLIAEMTTTNARMSSIIHSWADHVKTKMQHARMLANAANRHNFLKLMLSFDNMKNNIARNAGPPEFFSGSSTIGAQSVKPLLTPTQPQAEAEAQSSQRCKRKLIFNRGIVDMTQEDVE